jgi:ketosteroid isomerase-like protein
VSKQNVEIVRKRNIFEVYESFRIVPDRFLDFGDKVLVVAHNRAVARRTGMKLDQTFGYVWTVRAGRLARVEVYASERDALEAAGRREQEGHRRS